MNSKKKPELKNLCWCVPLFDACMKMHAVSNAVVVNIVGQKCIRVCLDIVFCDAGVYM